MLSIYLNYWFVRGPLFWWNIFRNTVSLLESVIAVKSQLANLTKPLFQDYSREGRVIGVIFRILRVVFGGILYGLVALFFCSLIIVWVVLPFILVFLIVYSFQANE